MCKIMILSGVQKQFRENAFKFCKEMRPLISNRNDDAFGYAAFTESGELFGERWHNPDEAFYSLTEGDVKLSKNLGDVTSFNMMGDYNSFGDVPTNDNLQLDFSDVSSIMLHARYATCDKDFKNTHPFVKDNTALIHNGMVYNHTQFKKELSTCDSEVLLHQYLDNSVGVMPENIKDALDPIRAYYAVGVMTKDKDNKPIVDIFKSSGANLHCAYINELEATVFSTSGSDIQSAVDKLGWTINTLFEVNNEMLIRLDAVTGTKISTDVFTEREFTSNYNYGGASAFNDNDIIVGVSPYTGEFVTQGDIDNRFYSETMIINSKVEYDDLIKAGENPSEWTINEWDEYNLHKMAMTAFGKSAI